MTQHHWCFRYARLGGDVSQDSVDNLFAQFMSTLGTRKLSVGVHVPFYMVSKLLAHGSEGDGITPFDFALKGARSAGSRC